jgi:site-specific DNA-methyltransferase (adenine-specific)
MELNSVHVSSKSDEWETPKDLFARYDTVYHFNLDAAATRDNAMCQAFFTKEDDALTIDWHRHGKSVWLNPPYGRSIGKFVKKAYEESLKGCVVVCLIPARTDTAYFHNYCLKHGLIEFLRGRLKFVNRTFPSWRADGNFKVSPAPFPSCIVIFGSKSE